MGQKVNPHGLRVGVIKDWDSKWYAEGDFADYLVEDYNIRTFLKKKLYAAGVSKIEIERASDRVKVIIYTAKPGVVIGKGGAEIEKIKGEVQKFTDSADENKTKEESVSGQKEDGKDEKNENPENSLSESNDKKEPEGSDSAQGADEQTIGSANGQDGVYIVEKGDTLAIISRKIYGDLDHVDTICKMNGITDGNLIYIGQKLLLP